MNRTIAALLLACATAFCGVKFELNQTGSGDLSRRHAEKLVAPPDSLPRMDADQRRAWLENATLILEQEARAQGFLSARVELQVQELDSAKGSAHLVAQLTWGQIYRFDAPSLLIDVPTAAYPDTAKFAIRKGERFRQDQISLAIQQLSEHYMGHGYLGVIVLPALDIDTGLHLVRTAFDIRPGRVARFGGMQIEGLKLTRPEILRGLWNANPNDTIRPTTIQSFTQKLYQAKLFSNVRVTPTPYRDDSSLSLVKVQVRERVPGSLDGLVSWDPIYGAGLEGVVKHRNVWGTLNELSLTGRLAQKDQLLQLGYGTPLLFGSDARMDYALSFEQLSAALADTTASRLFTIGNKGTFTYPVRSWATSWLTLTTSRNSYYYSGGRNRIDYAYSVELGQDFGQKNDAIDPTLGWSLSGVLGNGGEIGFDSSYSWISGQSRTWLPVWGPFLTAFALDGGMFLNSTTLDGAARFWQGGGRSVRSYGFNTLRDTTSHALRPRYVRGSGELRVNLPLSLQAVWFTDWTRIWNEGQPSHIWEITHAPIGYGVGLRYKISLLSLRLDYAIGRGDERFTFDLSQAI